MKTFLNSISMFLAILVLSGCAAFRMSVEDKDPQTSKSITARYDQKDLLTWGQMLSDDILSHPFVSKLERPVVADMGIQNRTTTHMDMQALADTMTTHLLDSGKMRFVNTSDRDKLIKEQGFQLANCTDETRVKIGRQLGAKYMLTGALTEITHQSGKQVRVSKQEDIYYQLTMKLTDLETGEIVMSKQRDRLRSASKPIIGY